MSKFWPSAMRWMSRESSGLPWIERNEAFHEVVTHFLRRYDLIDG